MILRKRKKLDFIFVNDRVYSSAKVNCLPLLALRLRELLKAVGVTNLVIDLIRLVVRRRSLEKVDVVFAAEVTVDSSFSTILNREIEIIRIEMEKLHSS